MTKFSTLTRAIKTLQEEEGFKERFLVNIEGSLETEEGEYYKPSEVRVVKSYTFTNKKNTSDVSAVYAIETEGGEKGLLIETWGSKGHVQVVEFLRRMEQEI